MCTLNLQASDLNYYQIKEFFKLACLNNNTDIMIKALNKFETFKQDTKAHRKLNFDFPVYKPVQRKINYEELTEMQDEDGNTPLYYAVRDGHIDVVTKLLQFGANPRNILIRQPHLVDEDIKKILIDAGARKRKRDEL